MDPRHAQPTITSPDLFLFAGEASGDRLGADLLQQLFKLHPSLSVSAVAGPSMRTHPIQEILPMEEFQVMGFIDVFLSLPCIIKHFYAIKSYLLQAKPKAIVFIDYPGFNLRMQRHLRKAGFTGLMIHYVCPSVWAWKKGRIQPMSEDLDLLLSVFPFEQKCFSHTKLRVEYLGHPLAEKIAHYTPATSFPPFDKPILAIFPGSRKKEVLRNLPLQLQAAIDVASKSYSLVISCAHPSLLPIIQKISSTYPHVAIHILPSARNDDLMHHAHLALATSGTMTLELALHKVPTIVTYAMTAIDIFLATKIFRIQLPYYCIVNYTANQLIFPELYGPHCNQAALHNALSHMIKSPELLHVCQEHCHRLAQLLYSERPSEKAAILITDLLAKTKKNLDALPSNR